MKLIAFLMFFIISTCLRAQDSKRLINSIYPDIQFFRPYDQRGILIFETTKVDTILFSGMKVRIGGGFTQDFQSLRHSNKADVVGIVSTPAVNANQLIKLTNGFNLAMANLYVDAQLADGIRVNVTMYLSSRHHEETWVKNGYVQVDKLSFFHSSLIDTIMKSITIRAGDLEVDYGDQHFRRTDGGNAALNPFIENYIMDEFATEIGTEIFYHSQSGIFAMGGITNGQLNPTVIASSKIDSSTGKLNKYSPAFHAKLGYDKVIFNDFRFRISGSVYSVKSTSSNTLFSGDRTGSHYFYVIENTVATSDGNAFSGRYNPMFSQQVNTFMINSLLKCKGLEFFGTFETAQGRTVTERSMRKATQYAGDLIYRFPSKKENFWVGARFNSLTAKNPTNPANISINRTAFSAGVFITKNLMMKAEYVTQKYKDFKSTDIRSGAQFQGIMLEAVVAF